jgi:hypothetical protein
MTASLLAPRMSDAAEVAARAGSLAGGRDGAVVQPLAQSVATPASMAQGGDFLM